VTPNGRNPVQLSAVNSTLLPPIITEPIFKKASESSAVMQLARKVPLSVSAATAIPVPMDVPTAGWVSEGGVKPVGSGGVGVKMMTGKKVALLVPVSKEVVMTNPAGLYDQLVQDLPTAIGRAFDYAAIHGLDLKTGGAGPFADYLAQTPNSQVIGSSAASRRRVRRPRQGRAAGRQRPDAGLPVQRLRRRPAAQARADAVRRHRGPSAALGQDQGAFARARTRARSSATRRTTTPACPGSTTGRATRSRS
jgi:hypothetical protein